ncbi:MAG: preprotein translocase subunit SecG [Bdellovibrionales bacterium]
MLTLLAVVHIFIGFALVVFVLLQDPKGGAMGVFSGGSSSNSFFGASGASNFLTTTTKWLAILFALSCLGLTYLTARRGGSVMDDVTPGATLPEGGSQPSDQAPPPGGTEAAPENNKNPGATPPAEAPKQ